MYASEIKQWTRSCYTFFWWHYIFLFDVTFFFDCISQNNISSYISNNYNQNKEPFFKTKRELKKSLKREKNSIIMNQNLKRNARKNSVVTYHKKYVTHLLKLKNDFHSFIAAIHPLTLLSLFDYFLSRSDRGWTYLSEMNINKQKK